MIKILKNIIIDKLEERYNRSRYYNPSLIEEINDDDMNYPKDNNNLIVNYMNNLWEKTKKFTKELLKKEDERKNKNNMIQSGSEIYENSLQNTINQEKIGTFDDINIYKMEYMLDEEKNFINKNRDIYNSGKRTYRLLLKVMEKLLKFL